MLFLNHFLLSLTVLGTLQYRIELQIERFCHSNTKDATHRTFNLTEYVSHSDFSLDILYLAANGGSSLQIEHPDIGNYSALYSGLVLLDSHHAARNLSQKPPDRKRRKQRKQQ